MYFLRSFCRHLWQLASFSYHLIVMAAGIGVTLITPMSTDICFNATLTVAASSTNIQTALHTQASKQMKFHNRFVTLLLHKAFTVVQAAGPFACLSRILLGHYLLFTVDFLFLFPLHFQVFHYFICRSVKGKNTKNIKAKPNTMRFSLLCLNSAVRLKRSIIPKRHFTRNRILIKKPPCNGLHICCNIGVQSVSERTTCFAIKIRRISQTINFQFHLLGLSVSF